MKLRCTGCNKFCFLNSPFKLCFGSELIKSLFKKKKQNQKKPNQKNLECWEALSLFESDWNFGVQVPTLQWVYGMLVHLRFYL